MWKSYRSIIHLMPENHLEEERRLIRMTKRGGNAEAEELVLRHIEFVIFRFHKRWTCQDKLKVTPVPKFLNWPTYD